MSWVHQVEKLFEHEPTRGDIYILQSSRDGASVAYMACQDPGGTYGSPKIVWNGRVMAESTSLIGVGEMDMCLSPDGRHLAVCRRGLEPPYHWVIDLDGKLCWYTDLDTIHHSGWLDNERFAWEGWQEDTDGMVKVGIRYFIHGDEVTGRLRFSGITDCRRTGLSILDMERAVEYTVWNDGERELESRRIQTEHGEWVAEDDWRITGKIPERNPDDQPDKQWDKMTHTCRFAYRRILSQHEFHEIENNGGTRSFVTSHDRDRIGYVGIRYPGWSRRLEDWVAKQLEREEGREDKGKDTSLFGWLLAFLFNPYMGIGLAVVEGSKRYYPVNVRYERDEEGGSAPRLVEHVWGKGYEYANTEFLTPSGELVIIAHEGNASCVVIDEHEGPKFDRIWNIRHIEGDVVSYVGLKNNALFRVRAMKQSR